MITIVASFELKPECIESFLAQASECIEASRKEEGNVDYNLYVSRSDPNKYFFIENWKDEHAIELHNASAHFLKFAGAFGSCVAGEPKVELLKKAE